MSVKLCSVSGSGLNPDGVEATTLGGSKPLHRFLRGQPKIIGNTMLVMGTSVFVTTFALLNSMEVWPHLQPTIFLGILFSACGILYILTEHNPTKKTVTVSLALSIISILVAAWTFLIFWPHVHYYRIRNYDHYDDDNGTIDFDTQTSHFADMTSALSAVLLFYTSIGAVIVIVMSFLAGAALRSTKSQAVVVMTAAPTERPAGN